MAKIDVVFFVEHKDRELETISLIAETLNRNFGFSVQILSLVFHTHRAYSANAKVFVLPYLLHQDDWGIGLLRKLYGDTAAYLNMNWEQLLFPINRKYKAPRDDFTKKEAFHLAWENEFKTFLTSNGVTQEHVQVTGNAANQLLYRFLNDGPAWREQLANEFGLDRKKTWLFFPENYSWSFSSDTQVRAKIAKGFDAEKAFLYRDFSRKSRDRLILFLQDVAKTGQYEIVLRPHPSITIEDWEQAFAGASVAIPKNLHILKSWSIREWIAASDVIGSSWSTSVWEAFNCGKRCFYFVPFEFPDWMFCEWHTKVPYIANPDDLYKVTPTDNPKECSRNSALEVAKYIVELASKKPTPRRRMVADFFHFKVIAKRTMARVFPHLPRSKRLLLDYFEPRTWSRTSAGKTK